MEPQKLIVSIHDVTPKYKGELAEIVAELDRIGITYRNVLVVPNWHGEYDLRNFSTFTAWLSTLHDAGDEIVQHGYNHHSARREYPNVLEWLMGEKMARGEAEFQNLDYSEAKQNLEAGKRILQDVRLTDVTGFIPPAWLINPNAQQAVKDAGFRYLAYTTFKNLFLRGKIPLKNLETGAKSLTPEITLDSYGSLFSKAMNSSLAFRITKALEQPLVRIAIHPPDIHYQKQFDYVLSLLTEQSKDRKLYTYRELVF